MVTRNLTPYQQGRLDGLCGVYAVINAARLACSGDKDSTSLPSRLLFETCLGYLALNNSLPQAVIYGFDTEPLLVCLRLVRNYLQVKRDIRIRQTRPFIGRKDATMADVVGGMDTFLSKPYRAVLLGYSAPEPDYGHWTVVKSVARTHFRLLDSDGISRLQFNRLTYRNWSKAKAERRRNLSPTGIIYLERLPTR